MRDSTGRPERSGVAKGARPSRLSAAGAARVTADHPLLELQRSAGNRATASLLAAAAGTRRASPDTGDVVRRSIDTTPKDLTSLRGRRDGPLIGKGTYQKIVEALKVYHERSLQVPELLLVDTIIGLTEHWLQSHPRPKKVRNDARSTSKKAQHDAVELLNAEAKRQRGILRAQDIYVKQTDTPGSFKALSTGTLGAESLGTKVAVNVVQGKSKGMSAFGVGKDAERLTARFKLNSAEVAAIRIFTLGDYLYINPAVKQDRSWMLTNNPGLTKPSPAGPGPSGTADGTGPSASAPETRTMDAALSEEPRTMDAALTEEPRTMDEALSGKGGPPTMATAGGGGSGGPAAATAVDEKTLATWNQEGALHGGMLMKAFAKLPPWRGVCFRGFRVPPKEALAYKPGDKIPYKTFGSTSMLLHTAETFATGLSGNARPSPDRTASVVAYMTIRNGRDIQQLSAAAPGEREIVILPGGEFTITAVNQRTKGPTGSPPATHWFDVYMVQTDQAAMKATPDDASKGGATTPAGTVLPKDPLGQVALAEAQRTIEAATKVEPKVTEALQGLADKNNGKLVGLENKFKSEPSLVRKVADRARTRVKGTDIAGAVRAELSAIWDALRYTVVMPGDQYKTFADKTLPDGLQPIKATRINNWNAWKESETYKGINQGYFITASGQQPEVRFEVQIHTDASFKMKSDLHGLYEEARAADTPADRRKQINNMMAEQWKKVPVPKNITSK